MLNSWEMIDTYPCLKITNSILQLHLPGVNELTAWWFILTKYRFFAFFDITLVAMTLKIHFKVMISTCHWGWGELYEVLVPTWCLLMASHWFQLIRNGWAVTNAALTHLPLVLHRWTGSALVQIMACRLDSAKPLSEPMLTYCEIDPKEHISMKFYLKFKYFYSRKCVCKCRLRNGGHFVSATVC